MDKPNIILLSNGQFNKDHLNRIAQDITLEYIYPVIIKEIHINLDTYYNPARRQYDANQLLKEIDSIQIPGVIKKIGLFKVDLFIPILTFIFGQAVYRGNSGIVSNYRLRNEQYGMKPDEEIMFERLRKVVLHELGHTFGLVHCHHPACVMRSSTYVEDIDQKKHRLCDNCKTQMMRILDGG